MAENAHHCAAGSPTRTIYCAHCKEHVFTHLTLTHEKKKKKKEKELAPRATPVRADSDCLPVSDLTVELCFFTGFADSRAQQSGELKDEQGGGGGGVLAGGWASYHLMPPFLRNPALSNAGESADEAAE